MDIKGIMGKILDHEELSREETRGILIGITRSEYAPEQVAALLTGLQMRGISVDELLGFRDGILETGVPAVLDCDRYIDIVGTGGDGKDTFNISTCACFVVAGAGYKVAKHGNYAATSTSGASNVIEAHGVKFSSDTSQLNRSIAESGVAYLHAPLFARALKYVAPVRRALPFPTCFNLLGPIVNPSRPACQLLGVATLGQMRLYRNVYDRMGISFGIINSVDGYDEISLTCDFTVETNSYGRIFSPSELGLPTVKAANLTAGGDISCARAIFDSVLAGTSDADKRDVVVANAAFAIQVMEPAMSVGDAIASARESLESGRALDAFRKFVTINS